MLYSMTSFGRSQKESGGYAVSVEMRTLNGRSLDPVIRLPKSCMQFEDGLRKEIGRVIRRGRVEVYVQIESTVAERKAPRISLELSGYYWTQLQELHGRFPDTEPPRLDHLLRIPHIFEPPDEAQDTEALGPLLTGALSEVLAQAQVMRRSEGEALRKDCLERLALLVADLDVIDGRKDQVVAEYQQRLTQRIQELLGDVAVDEARLLQEVACYADRADINEEIVRLRSHFDQMAALLDSEEPAEGRRLDFLVQELHREVNTIGSKTSDISTVQAVLRMKGEIGKLKEQVQNVE
ncbi:MAG: YicC/YloC family endoribonuclease [Syntrophobacteraceae bacterium]